MQSHQPVLYVDRASQEVREEVIYGEKWLRRLYERRLGGLLLWFIRSPWFSRFYGWLQDRPASKRRIAEFVRTLGIDPDESERRPEEYATFNEYFTRRLKPGRRPLAPEPNAFLSMADSRFFLHAGLDAGTILPVKGIPFTVAALLADESAAALYEGGDCLSFRLCPSDYHRYHFPADGVPGTSRAVPGVLYSVNPIALAAGRAIFAENQRQIVSFPTELFGELTLIPVGATCVGTIVSTHAVGAPAARGEEMGYFQFGGSSLLVLVPPGRVRWDEDLLASSRRGLETLVRVGERLGVAVGSPSLSLRGL